jgi:H+/Cl- antiporter ClcA
MGQQQLLPMILAAIVVGVAIITGMDMLAQDSHTAHEEEMRQTLLRVAGRAQEWYRRPTALNGGGRSFAGISWVKLNLKSGTTTATFTMSDKQQDSFTLTGTSKENPAWVLKYIVYADSLVAQ